MKVQPRSVIIGIIVIFVLYSVVTSPITAADFVRTVFVALADGVRSIFTFFDSLLNR